MNERGEQVCGKCLQPKNLAESKYVVVPGLHVCLPCAIEWELRQQMAALGWMKGAARPATEAAKGDEVGEAIGGTD